MEFPVFHRIFEKDIGTIGGTEYLPGDGDTQWRGTVCVSPDSDGMV